MGMEIGDKVFLGTNKYIIGELYFPNGIGDRTTEKAFVLYPPGKKKSYGYHTWAYEKDLIERI